MKFVGLSGIGILVCSVLSIAGTATDPAESFDLTFEDRVRAQRAIERVYHSHRIDAAEDFETAVPREVLGARVRRFLRQSQALERQWNTPITDFMLDREFQRMVRDSRDRDRLWELFAALGNDPVLVRECLVRPILVDRLVQNFHAYDRELHAGRRLEAEQLRETMMAGDLNAATPLSSRVVHEFTIRSRDRDIDGSLASGHEPGAMDAEEFAAWRAAAPPLGEVGPLVERRETFSMRIVLEEEPGRALVATHSVPKRTVNEWLAEFEAVPVTTVADRRAVLPARESVADVAVGWSVLPHSPSPREEHRAVWTGSEMLVWGDQIAGNTGSRYDPATDTWSPMSTVGAPAPRQWFTAVWTGSEMIVWGGRDAADRLNSGGRYDPVSDSWASVSEVGAPIARTWHSAVWTGSEMIVWGGYPYLNDDGRYDPSTDSWTSVSTLGAPQGRRQHTAAWTGTKMVVWGGYNHTNTYDCYDDGGVYDPLTDSWTPVSTVNAPGRRRDHTAVWTGTEMIVWGGDDTDGPIYGDGGRYDPRLNLWRPMTTVGAPSARYHHSAVWTGSEMIVWDGRYGDDGGRYDPASDSWSPVNTAGAPAEREKHSAVWTGTEMIVWGGQGPLDSGGRYSPATDSWTATASSDLWELELTGQTSLWTGNELIVWGGHAKPDNAGWYYLASGSVYNPTTGSRTRIVPGWQITERTDHTAVWTGSEMIVWGGCCWWDDMTGYHWLNDGKRYDPVVDAWYSVAESGGLLETRAEHTAVWTGSEMIVWGGFSGNGIYRDNGARYFPATNSWATVYLGLNAPSERAGHTAVWTGDELIVWGGYNTDLLDTGGRYDPLTGIWNQTPAAGAPTPRRSHTVVWTGEEMIVWGGNTEGTVGTGARYDLTNDLWTPTALLDAPSRRGEHSAVWTGAGMIVWGGEEDYYHPFSDGSMYVPETDDWVALRPENSPQPRSRHIAVIAGSEMIVWGGLEKSATDEQSNHVQAAFYELDDRDGDGLRSADDCDDLNPLCTTDCTDADADDVCVTHDCDDANSNCTTDCTDLDSDGYCITTDCDESNGDTYPNAVEINDGLDNQCPGDPGFGLIDEIGGVCGFHNPANRDQFIWPAQTGATSYEVARSADPQFAADCLVHVTTATFWDDGTPVPFDTCFHYLVCATQPNVGSWGASSSGVERTPVCP